MKDTNEVGQDSTRTSISSSMRKYAILSALRTAVIIIGITLGMELVLELIVRVAGIDVEALAANPALRAAVCIPILIAYMALLWVAMGIFRRHLWRKENISKVEQLGD